MPPPAAAAGSQLAPLSETRHKVQFTASDELRNKLERARDLMRHANADGDLAVVVERAVDLLLEKLERQRLGKTTRPRAAAGARRARRACRARRDARSSSGTASAAPSTEALTTTPVQTILREALAVLT